MDSETYARIVKHLPAEFLSVFPSPPVYAHEPLFYPETDWRDHLSVRFRPTLPLRDDNEKGILRIAPHTLYMVEGVLLQPSLQNTFYLFVLPPQLNTLTGALLMALDAGFIEAIHHRDLETATAIHNESTQQFPVAIEDQDGKREGKGDVRVRIYRWSNGEVSLMTRLDNDIFTPFE